ncbi:MAG: leucine--tRNA ligase [Planctomycetes bacterium]|nr:leucine--tRNA ligase [Planctomycetota bacterium]
MPRYDAKQIEPKWQAFWDQHQTFQVDAYDPAKPKLYVLDMFPYPSGAGLHVGHPEGYTATDIVCRYSRMKGKQVLHPMGWDAFGLPAEDYAIKTGTHPAITTARNIATFKRQLKMLGFSYDWSREFATTDPDYYRWTQWIFLQLFDTWYDSKQTWTGPDGVTRTGRGRPIAELPIPVDVSARGQEAVRRYQDKHRLAYQHEAPVNWCPALGTVLANEEVVDGKSERGGHPVERVPLRQWLLRITAYGDRLADELEPLHWPESIKSMQRNWIGRSEGAEVDFLISTSGTSFDDWKSARGQSGFPGEPGDDVLRIYTTRPDTLFGATYMVLAPEHPAVDQLTTPAQRAAVDAYRHQAATKSDLDRTDLAKDKSGVFTGGYAINPINGSQVPVWIADYVLISYGTGAIMAVPAHDLRDWEFAVKFQIPIIAVVQPPSGYEPSKEELALTVADAMPGAPSCPMISEGTAINSDRFNGLATQDFKSQITHELAAAGLGRKAVNYRLRDWLFSRQRYWGEPFPVWHELDADGQPTGLMRTDPEASLPIRLPDLAEFKPTGTPDPMLSKAPADWLYKTDSDGVPLKRETNTMPQWAGSCWYYLRFADPKNAEQFLSPEIERNWLPVDLYVGGAEHAVLHLLYSRFWHKVLFDRGLVSTCEPFQRLVNQGMILGDTDYHLSVESFEANQEAIESLKLVSFRFKEDDLEFVALRNPSTVEDEFCPLKEEQIVKERGKTLLKGTEIELTGRTDKMSKSRKNVVNPDKVVEEYGADSLRLYEMFMGPLEAVKPWSMKGVEGVYRFLGRVWRMIVDEKFDDSVRLNPAIRDVAPTAGQLRVLHHTIKLVTRDIESHGFNTAISRMMEFVNEFLGLDVRPRAVMDPFVLLLSPFAPHLAEELWQLLGHSTTLAYEPWPAYDEQYLVEAELEIPVQINGKLRGKITVPADADAAIIEAAAMLDAGVAALLEGKSVVKTVVIPRKMVNFVVK